MNSSSCSSSTFPIPHGSLISLHSHRVEKYFHQSRFNTKRIPISCCSFRDEQTQKSHQGFSILKTDVESDNWTIFSNMAFYMFTVHVPLSFGGVSAICNLLHQPDLEPETKALSILGIEVVELSLVLLLLNYSLKTQYIVKLFDVKDSSEERNWLLASATGFIFLVFLIFLTSMAAHQFLGPKEMSNSTLHELLSSGSISVTSCFLVYCVVTPLLEEVVYRAYLLGSLSRNMKWDEAVVLSSVVFSGSHFSGENFLQLVIIGCVLGCSYCWSGNLRSSLIIHSLYNSFILFLTFMS